MKYLKYRILQPRTEGPNKTLKHFLFGLVWLGVMSCCIVLQAYEIIHEFHAPFPIQTKYGPCRLLIFLSADTSAFHTLVGYVMGNNCLEDHEKDIFTIFSVCFFSIFKNLLNILFLTEDSQCTLYLCWDLKLNKKFYRK